MRSSRWGYPQPDTEGCTIASARPGRNYRVMTSTSPTSTHGRATRGFLARRPSLALPARAIAALTLTAAAIIVAGLLEASPATAARPSRGALVSSKLLARISQGRARQALVRLGIDPSQTKFAVVAYRLTYDTVTPRGGRTVASGLFVIPQGAGRRLHIADYEHGTQSARDQAPSAGTPNDGFMSGLVLGSAGLAAVAPDYLGLGTGAGLHPYLDVPSEVTASVDMLRAARTCASQMHVTLDPRVQITGFSQGGAAALAIGRELQTHRDAGFRLAALAPISGPYDLRGVEIPAALHERLDPTITPFYVGYLLTAWNRLYHLFPSWRTAFRSPYDHEVTWLYDGRHDAPEIARALPASLTQLLTPIALTELAAPAGRFARALAASTVCTGWRPEVPVHLFAASGDRTVPIANARYCRDALSNSGARVTLTDVGPVDHDQSAILSVSRVAATFRRAAGL